MKDQGLKNALKILFMFMLVCTLPILAAKTIKLFTKRGDTKNEKLSIDKKEISEQVEKYINENSESIVKNLLKKHIDLKLNSDSSDKINNAILLYENELFNENLAQYKFKNEAKIEEAEKKERPKILILFSDFDLILPIFNEIFNFDPEQLNAQIFFRQIVTQSRSSAILASYAYAVYKINPAMYIPFYIDLLSIEKKDLNQEKIDSTIKSFGIDINEAKKIADSVETMEIIKRTTSLSLELGIKELPAFIMENGQVFFGAAGIKIIKNLYKTH